MTVILWVTAAASLVAVWINIHRHVACFWIWAVTNATWAVIDFAHGIYAQAALQAVYFVLSIYGLLKWAECGFVRNGPREEES